MTLTELIHYFRNSGSFESFCQKQSLNPDSEVIEIFARVPLSVDSTLAFFEVEKTGGCLEYSYNDQEFRNLFDFYFFQDAIQESNNEQNRSSTDSEIARKLVLYAINNA